MNISKQMSKAITQQINAELYSAYLYMSMASYAESVGLTGTANWFKVQAKEEVAHAMKFYGYMNDRNEHVVLDAIDRPPARFDGMMGLFKAGLAHEKKVTAMINNLVKIARADKDNATEFFLQWFVNEQVEEEKNATDVLTKLGLIGDRGSGMYMLDRELGKRE